MLKMETPVCCFTPLISMFLTNILLSSWTLVVSRFTFFHEFSFFLQVNETKTSFCFGDRSSSDVIVRLRTENGRDEWLYCHSNILIQKSKYFSDRLLENRPTCQILDSRNCVEVSCPETCFDCHVSVLRLFYVSIENMSGDAWHNVMNALGILRVAVELDCPEIVSACVNYLEAVPWEENEEEEILSTIPGMGTQALAILSRLEPVDHSVVATIFISGIRFATSSLPPNMSDLKTSTQEQLEYMLSEDDDEPLLVATEEVRLEVRECMKRLIDRLNAFLESLLCEAQESLELFQSHLSDLSWACQILTKLEIMRELVVSWTEVSDKVVKVVQLAAGESNEVVIMTKLKAIEVASKVLETISYGSVILPTSKRLHMVKIWLPFVRAARPLIDDFTSKSNHEGEGEGEGEGEVSGELKIDAEMWQSLESTFVSIILALPSADQAEILNGWLVDDHPRYPDLTEAFDVWCYRTKVAKRRLAGPCGKEGQS
ncbi:hypothetical protein SAY87_026708 [Trapa incisa]|uniref:BTB/POZ domain-containing protein n=1 Tax=Trapa incisa TaxID=236973 RepID=A0AAN7JL89_9MYRT|nr:hypothetical protein SAY87_026708 [Trapa incisa]